MQISNKALLVLGLFLSASGGREYSGAEIAKALKIGSGTLYPMLLRFETSGWMESHWEDVDPSAVGRPRRRLYRLTALGQRQAAMEFDRIQAARGGGGFAEPQPVWTRGLA